MKLNVYAVELSLAEAVTGSAKNGMRKLSPTDSRVGWLLTMSGISQGSSPWRWRRMRS